MQVFRIENATGYGPYQDDLNGTDLEPHPDDGNQPTPFWDRGLRPQWLQANEDNVEHKYSFGFESLDQLRKWFHDSAWLKQAERDGFQVSVYDVPEEPVRHGFRTKRFPPVLKGDSQLCFWKDAARFVRPVSLSAI